MKNYLIVIASVLLLGVGGYAGYQYISKKEERTENRSLNQQIKDDLENGIIPNYELSQYEQGADQLEVAMKGIGNDGAEFLKVFDGVKNVLDLRYLIKAFGVRDGQDLEEWLGAEYNGGLWIDLQDGTRISTVQSVTLLQVVRQILKHKKILYAI